MRQLSRSSQMETVARAMRGERWWLVPFAEAFNEVELAETADTAAGDEG